LTPFDTAQFRRMADRVFGLVGRVIRDRDEALDITQEAIIRSYRQCRSREEPALLAFAIKTGYRLALNASRDARRRREHLNEAAAEQVGTAGTIIDEMFQRRQVLDAALEKLSDRQQQALRLRFFADLTIAETAAVMRISDGAVKVHLARGLARLRERFEVELSKGM